MIEDKLILKGVNTHNLKNINITIPLGRFTVVTGVSGSGKTSLVFDTIYSESYRRYVESLSSFARQYIKTLPKPKIDYVENLQPAVAVKQHSGLSNQRSSVGTLTEAQDFLQVIFSQISQVQCSGCQNLLHKDTPNTIHNSISSLQSVDPVLVLAPLGILRNKLSDKTLVAMLIEQGLSRVLLNEQIIKLEELDTKKHDIFVASAVLDRLTLVSEDRQGELRWREAINSALKLSQGQVILKNALTQKTLAEYTTKWRCTSCDLNFDDPHVGMFSFNHPKGACDTCQGFGKEAILDWKKIIPDHTSSMQNKGIAPLNFGEHATYYKEFAESAKKIGLDFKKPFEDFTAKDWEWLKTGAGKFKGMQGYFTWLDSKKYKPHYRIHAFRYRKYVTCTKCDGSRLKKTNHIYVVNGLNIIACLNLSFDHLTDWAQKLDPKIYERAGVLDKDAYARVAEACDELRTRIEYIKKVGLGYLSCARVSMTLSGGELGRIQMARCVGNRFTETLICLDEPTCGLHPRDSENLLKFIYELRDQGNTVIAVEHEDSIINGADHIIEIGPKSGAEGGSVVFNGDAEIYKQARKPLPIRRSKAEINGPFLDLKGAKIHNLKNVDIKIPLGTLTVVCGVSGSGKSSLITHSLYPLLKNKVGEYSQTKITDNQNLSEDDVDPNLGKLGGDGLSQIGFVERVTQDPIGRSSRSCIVTYIDIYEDIRKSYSATFEAQKLGIGPSHFSFNVEGGRCEQCCGLGQVVEDLSFLGEMWITCPGCLGERFNAKVLSVKYLGKNLFELLQMTVAEAYELYKGEIEIATALRTVMDFGLGYISLGQSTSSFSGGEAQRLKLLKIVTEQDRVKKKRAPGVFIFDEPTTGLSDKDVIQLLEQLRNLGKQGHTVILIEHNTRVVKEADWVIELGPDAGEKGGIVVAQGLGK